MTRQHDIGPYDFFKKVIAVESYLKSINKKDFEYTIEVDGHRYKKLLWRSDTQRLMYKQMRARSVDSKTLSTVSDYVRQRVYQENHLEKLMATLKEGEII